MYGLQVPDMENGMLEHVYTEFAATVSTGDNDNDSMHHLGTLRVNGTVTALALQAEVDVLQVRVMHHHNYGH